MSGQTFITEAAVNDLIRALSWDSPGSIIQLLLGHSKLESTIRYLGIEVEDALAMAEETEV